MIKTVFVPVAVVLVLTLPVVANAQALWRNVRLGEDLTALRQDLPAAVSPAAPLVLSAGEVEGLFFTGEALGGRPAEAHLFLRDGRLSSVQLRATSLSAGDSVSNLAFARRVAQGVTVSGGAPYSCVDDHFAAITRFDCKWLRGEVVVHESYLDVDGQAPLFFVAYRRADDPAFDS